MDSDSSHSSVVTVEAPGWASVVTEPEAYCQQVTGLVLDRLLSGPDPRVEIGIVLTDDARVRDLNRAWRGQDKPTNVLSFPSGEQPGNLPPDAPWLLGDVALALETLQREAAAADRPAAHHLAHLLVHGILHLLGHDHEDEAEAEQMERLEALLLRELGLPDPHVEALR